MQREEQSHINFLLFVLFMNDVLNMLNNSNCLMFVGDLKVIYLAVMNLQRDSDMLSLWREQNCLSLNINKFKAIFFNRKRCPINGFLIKI